MKSVRSILKRLADRQCLLIVSVTASLALTITVTVFSHLTPADLLLLP